MNLHDTLFYAIFCFVAHIHFGGKQAAAKNKKKYICKAND